MAAGQGFKTFATGDVLSAADVNGYLMQGVLVFADSAERDAEITSPEEGQFAYLKDTDVTTYYTGSAWANLDTTGMTNPMTTTGDVIYSSSGSTPARLGIGTAGQVLKVNSGATAPEWGAAGSSGALTLISTTTLTGTASTITFSSIPSTYENLKIIWSATGADDYVKMTVNGVGTSTYYSQTTTASGSSVSATELLGSTVMYVGVKNALSSGLIDLPNYKRTTMKKTVNAICGRRSGTGANETRVFSFFCTNDATTAISQIDITSDSVFNAGSSFSLYGVS